MFPSHDLLGVQYYKTKKDAQKALNKRKALVLTQPADPDSPATKAYVKRQKLLKRNAPFNFNAFGDFEFHHIMNIGGPIALDTSDIAIVSKAMNRKLSPYNRRLNDIGEEIFNLIETKPEGYLKKIKEQNKKGKAIITEVKSKLPKEYRKLIGFNEVVEDNSNWKNPEYWINGNQSFVYANGAVTASYGVATSKDLNDSGSGDTYSAGLKTTHKNTVDKQAYGLLQPNDWLVIRNQEVATP